MTEQATPPSQVPSAVDSMRKQADQAARALGEQARAMKEMGGASADLAQTDQADCAAPTGSTRRARQRVLGQLQTMRRIAERDVAGGDARSKNAARTGRAVARDRR